MGGRGPRQGRPLVMPAVGTRRIATMVWCGVAGELQLDSFSSKGAPNKATLRISAATLGSIIATRAKIACGNRRYVRARETMSLGALECLGCRCYYSCPLTSCGSANMSSKTGHFCCPGEGPPGDVFVKTPGSSLGTAAHGCGWLVKNQGC